MQKPTKITFAEMRVMGVRGVLIYCADYRCGHSGAVMADQWADDVRLSDIEGRFTCTACGKRGADVRPDFNWDKTATAMMGYRVKIEGGSHAVSGQDRGRYDPGRYLRGNVLRSRLDGDRSIVIREESNPAGRVATRMDRQDAAVRTSAGQR
jgi:hypothetical protein